MKKLKPKRVKARVKVLKAMPYKGCMVYLRQIDEEIFMYDLVFKNEIYSSYLIIKPKQGQVRLNESEVNQSGALIFTGACATIDHLLGVTLDDKIKKVTEKFIKSSQPN